jgi:hypothetical protein
MSKVFNIEDWCKAVHHPALSDVFALGMDADGTIHAHVRSDTATLRKMFLQIMIKDEDMLLVVSTAAQQAILAKLTEADREADGE